MDSNKNLNGKSMELQEQLQIRKKRGLEIAKTNKVIRNDKKWYVSSQTSNKKYEVTLFLDKQVCTCPDYEERQIKCKHIFAVEFVVSKTIDNNGSVTLTQTKRISYKQNWPAYNRSQMTEKENFMRLLVDLCKDVEEPLYRFGRPQVPIRDILFASALKTYTTFSLRRFTTDMNTAKEKGYIAHCASYSSISKHMRNPALTQILQNLIRASSIPLRSVETQFAIDSTGLRTTKFNDYNRVKHNVNKEHHWVKLHICTGVKTNIITAAETGDEYHSADNKQFIPLAKTTYENGFKMDEISADKAYSSREIMNYSNSIGAIPFVMFKKSSTGTSDGSYTWMRMFRFFTYNRDEFLEHYHKRSNVESTFNMIKAKFTDLVRSKDLTAQTNEALLKCICHNIVVLIHEIHELGLEIDFR